MKNLVSYTILTSLLIICQIIEIPTRTMMMEIMEVIGSKGSPVITSIGSGSLRFKVCPCAIICTILTYCITRFG